MVALSASSPLPNNDRTLLWAVVASLALHALLGLVLPVLKMEAPEPKPPQTLQVELAPPPKAAPAAVPTPEPETPEPVKPPEPTPPPPPVPKPTPVPAKPEPRSEPPRPEPPKPAPKVAEPVAQPQEHVTPAPEVMTVAPKEHAPPPMPVAPPTPAPPPPPAGPSQQDIDAARSQYSSLLARSIGKYKQYPKIAQMRGWQGEVVLEVHCDANGNVVQTLVKQSSGHNVLDEQAMTMVKKASPLPPAPDVLKNKALILLVPVPFTLEES